MLTFSESIEDLAQEFKKNIDLDAIKWAKENLLNELSMPKTNPLTEEALNALTKSKCQVNPSIGNDIDPDLFIFLSFSVPESTWIDLSNELKNYNGAIILRGLPNNSFKEFANRIYHLRAQGVSSPIQIDPRLFEAYDIQVVPSFVAKGKEGFDKVSGNISLEYATHLFKEKGNSKWH